MTMPTNSSSLPVGRDADATWVDHQVATRLFGAMPRSIGRYTIRETLGSGGMGLVYRAQDRELDRTVAVKLLNADFSTPEGARRMHNEAQAMARLSHPHVVQVYEVGQHRERVFLAMEYIEGETLEAWLRRDHRREVVHTLFLAIGEGIAAAHAVGVIHRDLKPANILVDTAGRPKVADFGLARTDTLDELEHRTTVPDARHGDSPAVPITEMGQVPGTPRYMAPEQHTGRPATPFSDQFSFCMMLWEALCAELPFPEARAAGTPGANHWILRPPPRGTRLNPRIRRALTRGLQVDPQRRWPSMPELLMELGRPSWLRRHPGFASVLLALLCSAASLALMPRTTVPTDPCDSEVERYEALQIYHWRDALDRRDYPPEARRYLAGMLADWTTETRQLCSDASRRNTAASTRALLRRAACGVQNTELLHLWLSEPIHTPTEADTFFLREDPRPPPKWHQEGLERSCMLTDTEAYDLLYGTAPRHRGQAAQGMVHARMLLHQGRARDAIARLDALSHRLPDDRPASYLLLRARAMQAAGADPERVMNGFYSAENAAERDDDELALFDARLEQTRTAIVTQQRAQMYHQTAPLPLLTNIWDHKLDTAQTLLNHRKRGDDDHLRLQITRLDLATSRGQAHLATALTEGLLADAERSGSPRLRAEIFAEYAGRHPVADVSARYDAKAIAAAPDDDELRGYLNYVAASRAFKRKDTGAALGYIDAAAEHYRRVFGVDAPQLASIAYTAAQALHTAGESPMALPRADAAVQRSRAHAPLQLALALYLRSAIHIRLGHGALAVRDAQAALDRLSADATTLDYDMWRTILQTAVVESHVASGRFQPAIELAQTTLRELDGRPALDSNGQREELQLALATAWLGLGQPGRAVKAFVGATAPGFLEYDDFKRAEALALRAGLPGVSAATASELSTAAITLFSKLGSDGAARLAASSTR